MTWPYLTPAVAHLPSAHDLGTPEESSEKIIQLSASNGLGQPYAVLTKESIYLYDQFSNAAISAHKRSKSSIEKYGRNVSLKRNHNDDLVAIQTDKDYLLVYAILKPINSNSDSEILSIYHQHSGNLLQNGLVAEKQTQFFQSSDIESPIWKFQIRFKLFLKVASGVVDYELLDKSELFLVTKAHDQLLNLSNDHTKNLDLDLGEKKIVNIIHSPKTPDLFVLRLNDGNFAFYDRDTGANFNKFDEPSYFQNCTIGSINDSFKLLVLVFESSKLIYYNYEIQQKVKEKDLSAYGKIKSTKWSVNGDCLVVLFGEGNWLLLTTFGSITFNSKEHDKDWAWLTNILDININVDSTQLTLTDGETIYALKLVKQSYLAKQINHDIRRPVLLNGSHLHIYTGLEISTSSVNKPINWNICKIPFENYYQIPNIEHVSLSQDAKFLAVTNRRALLIHSFIDKSWSFYINDYNTELDIGNITWFEGFNLLIMTNKTSTNTELIIFDFRRFKSQENFNSEAIIFKYDFNSDVQLLNLFDKDIIAYTVDNKFYHFRIETVGVSFKIDLIRILSLDKVFPDNDNFRSIIKVKSHTDEDNDLLILNNGELLYLKYKDNNKFEKNLLLDKVEYFQKINDNEYYLFNGESMMLIKDLNSLLKSRDASKNILQINVEHYPILMVLEKGLIVTLENSLIDKKTIELNTIQSENSIFLHDLIRFELKSNDEVTVYEKFNRYKNFEYSLELLLYQTIVNDEDLTKISKLIKINSSHELNIVSKCLRKIEVKYWSKLFKSLDLTPQALLNKSIEKKQFKTLGILIIIFLNYGKGNEANGDIVSVKLTDEEQIIKILKLIFENADKDDDLWETGFELIRFLKILDPSGALLKKGLDELKKG